MTGWLAAPKDGSSWLILLSLLFDIDGYLKRYAGGLVDDDRKSLYIDLVGATR